jgi:hypothetical protein
MNYNNNSMAGFHINAIFGEGITFPGRVETPLSMEGYGDIRLGGADRMAFAYEVKESEIRSRQLKNALHKNIQNKRRGNKIQAHNNFTMVDNPLKYSVPYVANVRSQTTSRNVHQPGRTNCSQRYN